MSNRSKINLSFKVSFQKPWSLLDDRIVYNYKDILLKDIQSANLICKSSIFANGGIHIVVNNKIILLAYQHKSKKDALIALKYIQEHCGSNADSHTSKISFSSNTVSKDMDLSDLSNLAGLAGLASLANLADLTDLDDLSESSSFTRVVTSNSPADELIKYKQLLDMGVLTQEEFDAKKKELLGL